MGDKSPKSKHRQKNQKEATTTRSKQEQAKRQAGFASSGAKEKDKK